MARTVRKPDSFIKPSTYLNFRYGAGWYPGEEQSKIRAAIAAAVHVFYSPSPYQLWDAKKVRKFSQLTGIPLKACRQAFEDHFLCCGWPIDQWPSLIRLEILYGSQMSKRKIIRANIENPIDDSEKTDAAS